MSLFCGHSWALSGGTTTGWLLPPAPPASCSLAREREKRTQRGAVSCPPPAVMATDVERLVAARRCRGGPRAGVDGKAQQEDGALRGCDVRFEGEAFACSTS